MMDSRPVASGVPVGNMNLGITVKRLQEGVTMSRLSVIGFLAGCIVLCSVGETLAQQRRWSPRPAISPYFNYLRSDAPIDNYNSFVRPRIELQRTLNQQADQIRRQQTGLGSLRDDVTRFQRESGASPTGTGAGFMNYSHFYSRPRQSNGR